MLKKLFIIAVGVSLCAVCACTRPPEPVCVDKAGIDACFTPGEDCTASVAEQVANAKKEILVQAYSFTSAPIAKALADAHKRGADVRIILDKSNRSQKYSSYTFFKNAGVPVYIDAKHAIAHNKIMIIDRETVITGSFNFTMAAQEKNAENLLVIKSPELSAQYIDNWNEHRRHSE